MTTRAATRRFRPWRAIGFLAALVVFSLAGSGVWAYWSAGTGTAGNGAASATTVGAGQTPVATPAGTTVALSWAASALASGTAVSGYVVKRYNATTLAAQTIGSNCAGTITALTCTETAVPTGSWRYTVTPVFSTNWTGAESAMSPVTCTDATPPANNISLSNIVGGAAIVGTTAYYRGSVAGSFSITNTVTDAGCGPASSSTSALGGTTAGFAHTPSVVTSPTGGPYVSNAFTWLAGTTSSPTETVTGTDLANNAAITSGTLVNDSTAPTGSISYTNSYSPGRYVAVTFSGADSGSGLAGAQLQRQSANLRGGSCGAFGSFADIGPANPVSPFNDTSVTNSKCYRYQYVLTDAVGNSFTATTSSTALVDYAGAVRYATTGLIDQLRLGDSSIGGNTTALDTIGSLNPTYTNGATLGVNGDPQNDADTAVSLNGSTGWLQDKTPTGLPTGSAARSVEVWFKTTSTLHQTLFTYGSYSNGEEFGLWIDPSGSSLTTWGWGGPYDASFTTATTVDDGKWHQAVVTWNGSAMSLYIDGSLISNQAQTRNTVIDSAGLQIGDVNDAADPNTGFPFTGSLDEFSVYNTALTGTDVLNHFQLGANQGTDSSGPTGGSVTATGLTGTGGVFSTSTTLNLSLAKGSDPSGVPTGAAYLYRATATLNSTANALGTCGTFGAFSLVAADPSATYADAVGDNACYAYKYAVPDALGNYSTFVSGIVEVDTTPPSTPSLGITTSAGYYAGGVLYYSPTTATTFTLTVTSSDTSSGIPTTGYSFPTLGGGWNLPTGSGSSRTYTSTTTASAAGPETVTVTNNATGSAASTFTLTIDSTAPTATLDNFDGLQTSTAISVPFTAADSGSSIKSIVLKRGSSTYNRTAGTCGAITTFPTTHTNPANPYSDTGATRTCYQYQLVVTDNVNNVTTITGPVTKVN
jgi:hypothetical protein